jgi:hypothetical protein
VERQFTAANNSKQFYAGMDDMATRLSPTAAPLTAGQEDQLVGLITQTFGLNDRSRWTVSDEMIAQAQAFLAPPQLEVLRQIQEERQAAARDAPPRGAVPVLR